MGERSLRRPCTNQVRGECGIPSAYQIVLCSLRLSSVAKSTSLVTIF